MQNVNVKLLTISVLITASLFAGKAMAGAQLCSNVQYSPKDDTQLHILTYVEPELVQPAEKKTDAQTQSAEGSTSWFSWLTESHNMKSLHFLDFLEIFKKEK